MPPHTALEQPAMATGAPADSRENEQSDSLFEQFDWLYILCREKLFRDDTERMIAALWPNGQPSGGEKLIELGCGPGFYSRHLAQRFPSISVIGIDRSRGQIKYAREKAGALGLTNVRFEEGDGITPVRPDGSIDAVIASRLLTVLQRRRAAIAEAFRVLRPGGKLFVAEPRFAFWASIPLFIFWMLAKLTGRAKGCREPEHARVFSRGELEAMLRTQPWSSVRVWQDGRYQYALCEKA